MTSKQTSTLRPPVSSEMRFTASVSALDLTPCVAPSAFACASASSVTSTAMIGEQPAYLSSWISAPPTPPQPMTHVESGPAPPAAPSASSPAPAHSEPAAMVVAAAAAAARVAVGSKPAALRIAPYAVKNAQPSTQLSSYSPACSSAGGSAKTAVRGTTAYSASPANEYIATSSGVSPSVTSRVESSYRWPLSRLSAKKVSHVSSSPLEQKEQREHGMMNGDITLVPMGNGGALSLGPNATTSPQISWPKTAGCGNGTSPRMQCKSVWQTPHALTFTSTSSALGRGVLIVSMTILLGSGSPRQTTAFIVAGRPGAASSEDEPSSAHEHSAQ